MSKNSIFGTGFILLSLCFSYCVASDTADNPDPVIAWNNDTKKITLHTENNTVPYDATNPPTLWSYSIDFPGTNYPSVSTVPLRLTPGT